MKLGYTLCNFAPVLDIPGGIRCAKELGFDYVELYFASIDAILTDPALEAEVTSLLRRLSLEVTIHHALQKPDDPAKTAYFYESLTRVHRWVKENPDLCRIVSFDTWVDRAASLPQLLWALELFADTDATIATEDYPLNPSDLAKMSGVGAYANYAMLVDLGHMNVRLCDTGDQPVWCLANEGENLPLPAGDNSPDAFANAIGKKPLPICELHIHNNDGTKDAHQRIHGGNAPFAGIVRVLHAMGWDGYVTLESAPGLQAIPHDAYVEYLRQEKADWLRLWQA